MPTPSTFKIGNILFLIFISIFAICFIKTVYAAVSPLNFTVNMSEIVTINTAGGTPTIAIDVGGVTRTATYTSGSGSNALTFTYTPAAGDIDLDGISVASPIVLNGSTIKDLYGNDATLTFTPPATTNVRVNYPTLSLDFINNRHTLNGTAYTSFVSFLTSSGGTFSSDNKGTYFDSAGILQLAITNTPRFDYDPVSLTATGLLIEESRTNLVKDSEDITTANWSNESGSSVITPNVQNSPRNQNTADKMVDNASNIRHILLPAQITITNGLVYTGSFFAKAAEQQYVQALFGSGGFGSNAYANFQLLGSGSVTFLGSSITSATIKNVGNGWYRCSVSATANTTGTDYSLFIALLNNTNNTTRTPAYIGSGGGIYLWGFQVEQGNFVTSYIPTTSSPVTRAADNFTIPTGPWFSPLNGTLIGNGISRTAGTGSQLLTAIGTDTLDLIAIRQRSAPDVFFMGREGGTSFDGGGYPPVALNVLNKIGITYADNIQGVLSLNGAAPQTALTYLNSYGTSYTRMSIGSFPNAGGYWNGTIQDIKYFPLRAADSQLRLLTQ